MGIRIELAIGPGSKISDKDTILLAGPIIPELTVEILNDPLGYFLRGCSARP